MSAVTQKAFVGGEITPSLYARTDLAKYFEALRTCRNFMVMRHGGVTNRPGTTFRGEVKDSSKTVRLIPFVFNNDQTYILEFGNLYIRVYKAGNPVVVASQAISGLTNASPGVLTYVGADNFSNGDQVLITWTAANNVNDDSKVAFFNNRVFKVANVNAGNNTFEINNLDGTPTDTTGISAGVGIGAGTVAKIFEVVTTYVEADLPSLRFVQSADTITIVHPTYPPAELVRSGDASWALTNTTFGPTITAPTGLSTDGGAGTTTSWVVTAVDGETGEESLASAVVQAAGTPSSGSPITITIGGGGSGAPPFGGLTPTTEYNVYRAINGVYGYIGTFAGTTFKDLGVTPDITNNPPTARNPFSSAGNYPTAVVYHQNRRLYANTNNLPETVFASKTALYKNFCVSAPTRADDSTTWTMVGRTVNAIKHMLVLSKLLLFSSTAETSIEGDAAGTLSPGNVNPRQYTSHGMGELPPIIVQNSALFVQTRGNIVRDFAFDFSYDGYKGNDLTIMSAHLFDGYTIRDWAYQQIPHSIVWVVRSDGTLLGLTYLREQQMLAWHRHDFQDATVEQVCCVPEGLEDAVYLVIKRTVNSLTKRYIERFATRNYSAIRDANFMDAVLSYNGINTGSLPMTLSGGTNWTYDETLTLTTTVLNPPFFTTADVGRRFDLTGSDGTVIRCTVTAYLSGGTVSIMPSKTVPASMRGVATTTWTKCIKLVSGLWHLEGKTVSVYADSFVVANPNNASYKTSVVVSGGIATLPEAYGVIYVGLPIIADLQTLDIDTAQGESLADKHKLVNRITAFVQNTRGLWVGPEPPASDTTDPLQNLDELKARNDETYEQPVNVSTDNVDINLAGEWNSNGRIFIRQIDPLPITILGLTPQGLIPTPGSYQP